MTQKPIHFDLQGVDVDLQCSFDDRGEPILRLGEKTFRAEQVNVTPLPIGSLITVTTLPSDRVGRGRLLSVLLPVIESEGEPTFETIGIETMELSGRVGGAPPVLMEYRTIALRGTARSLPKGPPA